MLGFIEERAQDADVVLTRGACNISNFTLHFVIHLHNAHVLRFDAVFGSFLQHQAWHNPGVRPVLVRHFQHII